MKDVIVSIRMPWPLVSELRELAKTQNFLDLSEEIRSIVRQKWNAYAQPELFHLKKLREGIESEIRQNTTEKIQKEVVRELEMIKSQLKKGGFSK